MPQTTAAIKTSPEAGPQSSPDRAILLDVSGLTTVYRMGSGQDVFAVNDVGFRIAQGRVLGLVGESGCGKTTTGLSVLRLIRSPGVIRAGRILFRGEDLARCGERRMRQLRGEKLAMIFQNPMSSLNPTERVDAQITEVLSTHRRIGRGECDERVLELLELVGIPGPRRFKRRYPHELSGGMRQRVLIAVALAAEPEFLVADEPTTALDVTIQAQILWLLEDLQQRLGMGMLYITHDLLVAASISHEIGVMYGGLIVERAPTTEIFDVPAHPYTGALISAQPRGHWREREVHAIPGQPPVLVGAMSSCPFAPRCPLAVQECAEALPPAEEVTSGHTVRCYRWRDNL